MTEEIIITGEFDIRGLPGTNNFKKPLTYCKIIIDYPSMVRIDSMSSFKKDMDKGKKKVKAPGVFIERAALCTIEGIRALCGTDEEYSEYVLKIKQERKK